MYLICINLSLGLYTPSALVNTNQIHHSYTCYNYNLISTNPGPVHYLWMRLTRVRFAYIWLGTKPGLELDQPES